MIKILAASTIALAVGSGAAAQSCSGPGTPGPSPSTSGGTGQCQPGWVCGTCPDGTEWGYLNDPKYTNDPKLSTLFFDDKHPCG